MIVIRMTQCFLDGLKLETISQRPKGKNKNLLRDIWFRETSTVNEQSFWHLVCRSQQNYYLLYRFILSFPGCSRYKSNPSRQPTSIWIVSAAWGCGLSLCAGYLPFQDSFCLLTEVFLTRFIEQSVATGPAVLGEIPWRRYPVITTIIVS